MKSLEEIDKEINKAAASVNTDAIGELIDSLYKEITERDEEISLLKEARGY